METPLRKYLWAVDGLVIALCAVFLAAPPRRGRQGARQQRLGEQACRAHERRRPAAPAYSGASRGDPEAEHLLLDLPAHLAGRGQAQNFRWFPATAHGTQPEAAGDHVRAAAPPIRAGRLRSSATTTPRARPTTSGRRFATRPSTTSSRTGSTRLRRRASRVPGPARPPAAGGGRAGGGRRDPCRSAVRRARQGDQEDGRAQLRGATVDARFAAGQHGCARQGARIVPETRDGKSAGFRLFSIRPDGPFAKIGLLNGDVVSSINGLEMTSPDQALLAYTKLKTANHLSVAIERNGQKITKDYNIR